MQSRTPPKTGRGGAKPSRKPHPGPAAAPGAPSRALLDQTVQALDAVLTFEFPADAVLSRHFRDNRTLGQRDRAFIAETVYGIVRRLRWLHRLAGNRASARQLLLAWLARGEGWPARQLEELTSTGEREWITKIKATALETGSIAEQADLPDWLAERLLATHDENALLQLAHGLNSPAPLDLRVNALKSGRDAVLERLQAEGLRAETGAWSPQAIRLAGKPALQKHPLFLDGTIEVQDEGSQILGLLVQPRRGELVVDFCAGAGGKTLQLGAMMRSSGRLYAFDISEKRLAKLKPRMARAGLSNVHPTLIAHENDARLKRLAGKADRVLVDAPCSGLGTLRRNPDIKWRQTPAAVDEMIDRQHAILAAAARLVRPGGRLVYATCSLLAEENDAVVDAFLEAHPAFRQIDASETLAAQGVALATGARLRLFPHQHGTDGFFAAVLERTTGA